MTAVLFPQDSRADAFSFSSGSTVSFDVITNMSPQQNAFVLSNEKAADFAYSFLDNRTQSQSPASVLPTGVQQGMPEINTNSVS